MPSASSQSQLPILALFERDVSFVLSGHENPDGDCLGSQVALYHLLRGMGRRVTICNPDPLNRTHEFLSQHTPFTSYRQGAVPPACDVLVLLDCARLQRVGPLGEQFRQRQPTIAVIDHHVGSESGDGTVCFVDAEAPSTGALVHDLYRSLGRPLSPAAAQGVMLSLVADTGWFRYSNTTPQVLALAAELMTAGVSLDGLYDQLFRRNQPESVGLLAKGLAAHETRYDGRYVFTHLDRYAMELASQADYDTDAIMDPLRSLAGVEVVAFFKERATDLVKLSLRSQGEIDVQSIANQLGGGGHRKASGATLRMPLRQAMMAVDQRVREALAAKGTANS